MTYEGRDLEVLADMPNYYGWIMSWFAPYVRGRVVEYGAGAGTVSKLLRPLADRLTLVEPSANLLPVLQARFPRDPGVEIGRATLEEHSRQLPDGAMDTVVLVNVLEHIEDDRSALAEHGFAPRIDGVDAAGIADAPEKFQRPPRGLAGVVGLPDDGDGARGEQRVAKIAFSRARHELERPTQTTCVSRARRSTKRARA